MAAAWTKVISNKLTSSIFDTGRIPTADDPNDVGLVPSPTLEERKWNAGWIEEYPFCLLGHLPGPFPLIRDAEESPLEAQIVDVIEEAVLKGFLPAEASSPRPRPAPGPPVHDFALLGPRPVKLHLSLRGLKIAEATAGGDAAAKAGRHDVKHREPLHSILCSVAFESEERNFVAVAVRPRPKTVAGNGQRGEDVAREVIASPGLESDVVHASFLVFQTAGPDESRRFNAALNAIFNVVLSSRNE